MDCIKTRKRFLFKVTKQLKNTDIKYINIEPGAIILTNEATNLGVFVD